MLERRPASELFDLTGRVALVTGSSRGWGSVDELGGAIVLLASDASSFVNGQTIFVNGGMTAVV